MAAELRALGMSIPQLDDPQFFFEQTKDEEGLDVVSVDGMKESVRKFVWGWWWAVDVPYVHYEARSCVRSVCLIGMRHTVTVCVHWYFKVQCELFLSGYARKVSHGNFTCQ